MDSYSEGQNNSVSSSNSSGKGAAQCSQTCPLAELLLHKMKKPWFKRHPILFIVLLLVVIAFVHNIIVGSKEATGKDGTMGLVTIYGPILSSEKTVEWIHTLARDKNINGILVRVDSPGGAVTPSEEIYMALKRVSTIKPVVVSMGSVAASGGYFIALAGHKIFASPSSLTGSIGVIMDITNLEQLFKTLGIASTAITSGQYKDAGSPFKPLSPEDKKYFQSLIEATYEIFLQVLMDNRHMTRAEAASVADGRVFIGTQALQFNLIDHLGDMQDAKRALQEMCGLAPDADVAYREEPEEMEAKVKRLLDGSFDMLYNKILFKHSERFYY